MDLTHASEDQKCTDKKQVLKPTDALRIPLGTSSSIEPEIGKYYFLLATNSGGATTINISQILGVENTVFENFTYFPNPTSGVVTLKNNSSIEKVVLRNILGAVVLETAINATQTSIDLSNLSSGSYILSVFANGQRAQYHILKE